MPLGSTGSGQHLRWLCREYTVGVFEPRDGRMRWESGCEARKHGAMLQRERQVTTSSDPILSRSLLSRIGYSMIASAEEAGVIKPGVVGVRVRH